MSRLRSAPLNAHVHGPVPDFRCLLCLWLCSWTFLRYCYDYHYYYNYYYYYDYDYYFERTGRLGLDSSTPQENATTPKPRTDMPRPTSQRDRTNLQR